MFSFFGLTSCRLAAHIREDMRHPFLFISAEKLSTGNFRPFKTAIQKMIFFTLYFGQNSRWNFPHFGQKFWRKIHKNPIFISAENFICYFGRNHENFAHKNRPLAFALKCIGTWRLSNIPAKACRRLRRTWRTRTCCSTWRRCCSGLFEQPTWNWRRVIFA
jgi:hypothetical protein